MYCSWSDIEIYAKGFDVGKGQIHYLFNKHDPSLWRHMKRCHGRLHYDRKFQIFLFLIGCINVNKGVFCLIISYLRIKSYSVLNYNNCSTDWSFPLTIFTYHIAHKAFGRHNRGTIVNLNQNVIANTMLRQMYASDRILFNKLLISS